MVQTVSVTENSCIRILYDCRRDAGCTAQIKLANAMPARPRSYPKRGRILCFVCVATLLPASVFLRHNANIEDAQQHNQPQNEYVEDKSIPPWNRRRKFWWGIAPVSGAIRLFLFVLRDAGFPRFQHAFSSALFAGALSLNGPTISPWKEIFQGCQFTSSEQPGSECTRYCVGFDGYSRFFAVQLAGHKVRFDGPQLLCLYHSSSYILGNNGPV